MALVRLGLPPALISAAILYAASLAAPLIGAAAVPHHHTLALLDATVLIFAAMT